MDVRYVYVLGVTVNASKFKSRGRSHWSPGVLPSAFWRIGICRSSRRATGAPSPRESLPGHGKCRRPLCTTAIMPLSVYDNAPASITTRVATCSQTATYSRPTGALPVPDRRTSLSLGAYMREGAHSAGAFHPRHSPRRGQTHIQRTASKAAWLSFISWSYLFLSLFFL